MTQSDKYKIEIYRAQGLGYTEIAKKLAISVNSIKSFCKRHNLGGKRGYAAAGDINILACENCGKEPEKSVYNFHIKPIFTIFIIVRKTIKVNII